MDHIKKKSRFPNIKRNLLLGAAAVVVATILVMVSVIDFSSHRVKAERINIASVERGPFEIKVAANGELRSDDVEQLTSLISGRVALVHVRPGAQVKAGDVLMELINPQLVARAEEAQSALEGAEGALKSVRAELRSSLLNQERQLIQAQFDMEIAELQLELESQLIGQKIISELDYKRTELNVRQARQLYQIESARLKEMRDNVNVQIEVAESQVNQMARVLERAQNEVDSLQVNAGISGIVQSMEVEVGQQLVSGSLIGRVARHDALYAELRVPARDAANVSIGQSATIDIRTDVIEGTVSRVDPGVTDGAVIVDVDLQGAVPGNARPHLQVEGTIFVAQIPDAIFVSRPAYVKSDSRLTVYKLEANGRYAIQTTINTGKLSLQHVEVLHGLDPGDQIIVSEIGEWQNFDRILIN